MTQKEKDILLKDLCSRLPYGVKVQCLSHQIPLKILSINPNGVTWVTGDKGYPFEVDWKDCKPYLFPISSMTEEQKNSFPFSYSFLEALIDGGVYFYEDECITLNDMIYVIQWCYKNHFDIHGLIPMGLANDATDKNIY